MGISVICNKLCYYHYIDDVFDDFKDYTEYSRTEKILGNVVYVNADDFSYQTDNKILRKIDEFMRGC